ncbi:MAG: hypothetical protein JNK00_13110 [Flavipsychrobacter sp.]|nr:hypothetical protein [Flavipsychrobacter sp.]
MPNDLVGYSRAGDTFHYRWAARRCLRMVNPNSPLKCIVVEGSNEISKEGEYVIDVSEYYQDKLGNRSVEYFQLKHSTLHANEPFTLSDFDKTLLGFAKRFKQHLDKNDESYNLPCNFSIVTNRAISSDLKGNFLAISKGESATNRFKETLEKYTKLNPTELSAFCRLIQFEDSEGDYRVQKEELRFEIAQLLSGTVDNTQLTTLIALVEEKILPHSNHTIIQEDVLRQFEVTSINDLYPAPSTWEPPEKIIVREQHNSLNDKIVNSNDPIIIHAAGGVGKSVFCKQFIEASGENSVAIAYDCFGAGTYRNRSKTRHRHRTALVQIVNELATKGICDPIIPLPRDSDEDLMKTFISRINNSVDAIKKSAPDGKLFILIDAADNAEMAAHEFNQNCFAHELLREVLPSDCKLIFLCRTERIGLLSPLSNVLQLELYPFSERETLQNLLEHYPTASKADGNEFHRLSAGNPRVQANALDGKYSTVDELLQSLGPSETTVEDQIRHQLNLAVNKIIDSVPIGFNEHVTSICTGLACLPPNISIDILAQAASVDRGTVVSFITDIGRSLWMSDSSVQFRDEPTETWFRETFSGNKSQYAKYIENLESLADKSTYVAETLPQLYLQAEQYEKLITIALSDNLLPTNNPIDARNVRVYRLQFAFKAALKLKKYKDAIFLAMCAGEEMAGNLRQMGLLQANVDMLVKLQSKERIQEFAYRKALGGSWEGSENVYSASLLSSIAEYKGEARGYLRAGRNWLRIYFSEAKKNTDLLHKEKLEDRDLVEFAFAYLNLDGVKESLEFLNSITPKKYMFSVMRDLATRVIDSGDISTICEFLRLCDSDPYFNVAIVSELMKVGFKPDGTYLKKTLRQLCNPKSRIDCNTDYHYNDDITPAILSFLEACLRNKLSGNQILSVLTHYVPTRASDLINSYHERLPREIFVRGLAIRAIVTDKHELDFESILPESLLKEKKDYKKENEKKKYYEVINGLFPWYLLRLKVISGKNIDIVDEAKQSSHASQKATSSRYGDYDTLPEEISSIICSILANLNDYSEALISAFYNTYYVTADRIYLPDRLDILRTSYRQKHLDFLKHQFESKAFEIISKNRSDQTESVSERYIKLSRAVSNASKEDAVIYFDEAIKIASKFGDEISERWLAIIGLAKKAAQHQDVGEHLAYRFIRCAEVVGENVEEKHWAREEAIAICTRLSTNAGISALSRWRERDIGYFDQLLTSLIFELLRTNKINASTGWSLTRLISRHALNPLVDTCLEKEASLEVKMTIFNDAIEILSKEGCDKSYWSELQEIGRSHSVQNSTLDSIISYYDSNTQNKEPAVQQKDSPARKDKEELWNAVFEGIDLSTLEGLKRAKQNYKATKELSEYGYYYNFWVEAVHRAAGDSLWALIDSFLLLDDGSVWEVKQFFNSLPSHFKDKISFKNRWPEILHKIGKRYAFEIASPYSFPSIASELAITEDRIVCIKEGIFERLSENSDFNTATSFFEFVNLASDLLNPTEAVEALDYSLHRFELHVEDDFGDGVWNTALEVNSTVDKAIGGLIWSALATPSRAVRWKAAHVVRQLGTFNVTGVIESLITWLEDDQVKAFGISSFKFYNLHARLYLLISLARIAKDSPALLKKYGAVFPKYALEDHVLIQKYAKEIVLRVENAFPGTFDVEVYQKVLRANTYDKRIKKIPFDKSTNSYWHKNNLLKPVTDNYHFGWDFDNYWFNPLGRVFGVSGKQVEELAEQVIRFEWNVEGPKTYKEDARHYLWNRYSGDRETWHDHFDYPRADDLSFYYSYHSLFVAAAKLLSTMPVVCDRSDLFDTWEDWIDSHIVTRSDGLWLSDMRDPVPLIRPSWVNKKTDDNWRKQIKKSDFIDNLILKRSGESWIAVSGGWSEVNDHRKETYSVSTALVGSKASNALLQALMSYSDPYDYKLPDYEERDKEISFKPFELKGWIIDSSISKGIDQFDPYGNELGYPPDAIGEKYLKKLNLLANSSGKTWSIDKTNEIVIKSETWKSFRYTKDDEFDQSGSRTVANLEFLKRVCKQLNCDIMFDFGINRDFTYRYQGDKYEHSKPQHLIFILSADGTFRDSKRSYKIR